MSTTDNDDDDLDMAAAMQAEGQAPQQWSQDEIDKRMGQVSSAEKKFGHIIDEMIYRSMENYERMPMLEFILERFMLSLPTALKSGTSSAADATLIKTEYQQFDRCLDKIPVPGILAVCNVKQWKGDFLIAMDAPLCYAALELILGGRKSTLAPPDGRAFSSIERSIAQRVAEMILKEVQTAFEPLTPVEMSVERIETNPQFATVTQPSSPTVHLSAKIVMEGRIGRVDILIPYPTLDPVRKILTKMFFGAKIGGDEVWKKHLDSELNRSKVDMKAVMHEFPSTLADVLSWQPGQTLSLDADKESPVTVYCNGVAVVEGKLGKASRDKYAVRVTRDLPPTHDAPED